MNKVIPEELKTNVFIYLDDLLVISADFDTHITLLGKVAECLRKAKLTIGLKKSKFCFQELQYLGFIVGGGVMKSDPEKVQAIRSTAIPKNIRAVRSFLDVAGWCRRCTRNFSGITLPLTNILKKGKKFEMTDEALKSFGEVKYALTHAPLLLHPDFKKHFFIQCDASNVGVGDILFQLEIIGPGDIVGLETVEFESPEYLDLIQTVM